MCGYCRLHWYRLDSIRLHYVGSDKIGLGLTESYCMATLFLSFQLTKLPMVSSHFLVYLSSPQLFHSSYI